MVKYTRNITYILTLTEDTQLWNSCDIYNIVNYFIKCEVKERIFYVGNKNEIYKNAIGMMGLP